MTKLMEGGALSIPGTNRPLEISDLDKGLYTVCHTFTWLPIRRWQNKLRYLGKGEGRTVKYDADSYSGY